MKKALSIILCLAMLMSTVPMSVFAAPAAVTVGDSVIEIVPELPVESQENDSEEAELAADGTVMPVKVLPEAGATVDRRYPVAYYTFSKGVVIDEDTVTLENVGNDAVGGVYFDKETNSIWVFPAKPESTVYKNNKVEYTAWTSNIAAEDGSLLYFPGVTFNLETSIPSDGKNIIPFGNMEYGWTPLDLDEPGGEGQFSVVEDPTNPENHVTQRTWKKGTSKWPHAHADVAWTPGATYKVEAKVMAKDFVNDAGVGGNSASTSITPDPIYTVPSFSCIGKPVHPDQTGTICTVCNKKVDREHETSFSDHPSQADAATVSITSGISNGWQTISYEFTVRDNADLTKLRAFSIYSNPGSNYATEFYVDDVAVYEKVAITYAAGRDSAKKSTRDQTAKKGYNGDKVALPDPNTRYQSTKEGYVLDGWTDGTNVYAVGEEYVIDGAVTLTPNVVPEGDGYKVTLSVDEQFADLYAGPGILSVAVGEELDLTTEEFALGAAVGYTVLGWKNAATDEIVTKVSGNAGDVIELVAAYELRTGIVVDTAAKAAELKVANASISFDETVPGLKVTPSTKDPNVTFDNLALEADKYSFVDVTYVNNETLASANGGNVYFMVSADTNMNLSNSAKGEKVSEDGSLVTYRYNLAAVDSWIGNCSAIRIDPYNNTEAFTITEIQFVENEVVAEVAIVDITAPAISGTPDTEASVAADAVYEIENVEWDLDGEYYAGSTEYTVTVAVKISKSGYMFDEDTEVTINGEAAEFEATSKNAVITKTFPATAAPSPVVITLTSADTITVNDGTLALEATVVAANGTDVILPDTLTWEITGGDEGVAYLDGNVLTGKWNGTVEVTATPDYDVTQSKAFDIVISGQEGFNVYYDKNTGADVENLPAADRAKKEYTVSSMVPTREGFTFEGWMLDPEATETVTELRVTSDVILYAKWIKGGYVAHFDNEGDAISSTDALKVALADGNRFGANSVLHTERVELDVENSEFAMTLNGGNDFYMTLFAGSAKAISLEGVKSIEYGFRTDASGILNCRLYFATKDEDGAWIAPEYAVNGQAYSDNSIVQSCVVDGNVNTVYKFRIDTTVRSAFRGFLDHARLDIENSQNFGGKTIYMDYVKLVGEDSVENIDLEITAPKASKEVYGIEAVTANSGKYEVKSVTWEGPELVDGKYYAGASEYTAKVTLEAAGGYALSDTPLTVLVNGEDAEFVLDGKVATVTYTFPATETLVPVELKVKVKDNAAAEITESFGTLQLEAPVRFLEDAGEDASDEVYWSIDPSQKRYAWVDENGLVKGNTDCEELVVTATSKYDPSVKASITIKITGQIPESNIYFASGTGEEVENLPAATVAKDEYVLPTDVIPTRTGYAFKGWSKTIGGEIIKVDDVHEDTTYYAIWGYSKGEDFDGTTDVFKEKSNLSGATLSDGILSGEPTNSKINEGFMLQAGSGIFGSRNRIKTDDVEYVEIKTNVAPENLEICVYVQSSNRTGGETTAWNEAANTRFYSNKKEISNNPAQNIFNYVEEAGDWYIYKLPVSLLKHWNNYLNQIRFNFIQRDMESKESVWLSYPTGYVAKFDYIRFVGKDIPAMEINGIEAPVVKGEAATAEAATVVQSDAFKVTKVTWSPELLGGIFFGSGTEYTVTLEVEPLKGYNSLSNPPAVVKVNGKDAEYKRNSSTRATITYTFPATEDIGELALVNVNLHETNSTGGTVTETKQIFSGDDFNLDKFSATNNPTGKRWIGWSETEGGELISGTINITEEADYYALYEDIIGYDFSNKYHRNEKNVTATGGTVSFDGAWVVVTPEYNDSAAKLTLDGMNIASADYDYLEIIYDGSLEDANNENKFSESLAPVLNIIGTGSQSTVAALVKAEPVIASNKVSYKYTYDLTVNGKPETITAFELAPYTGKPAWAITSATLIPNAAIEEAAAVTGIKAPETWLLPDVSAQVNDKYEIVSIDWTTDGEFNSDGSYASETAYTVTIVIKPVVGNKIVLDEATIDGVAADEAIIGADGNLTIKKTFPATDALVEFELSVEDAVINVADGTVQLVPVFTPEVEVNTVKWEIISNGPEGKSATIDENGVVTAVYDGEVVVKATADYNPLVTAEATVTITNQIASYQVTFDSNTKSAVTNMPETVNVKGEYVLPKSAPVRPGFEFAGWVKSPTDTASVAKAVITEHTTFYALWVRGGLHYEFLDENENSDKNLSVGTVEYSTVDTENGVLKFQPKISSYNSLDTIINISNKDGSPLFKGSDYPKLVVRMTSTMSSLAGHKVYFTSDLVSSYSEANAVMAKAAVGPDGYTDIVIDMSGKSGWMDGQITAVRFDPIDSGASMDHLNAVMSIDYIRAVDYETSVVEVSGIEAPVAKAVADTDAVSKDESKYVVTDVSWEGGLLHDYYFGGETVYTVCVTVKGAPGYFVSDAPTIAKVNGNDAKDFTYNAATGELTIKYEFPATGVLENSTAYDITLYGMNDSGVNVAETRTIFEGDTFEIGKYMPVSVPAGKRWIGWSTVAGAEKNEVAEKIVVDGPATYYAVFEDLVEFDYSNYYHTIGTTAKAKKLVFENGLAEVYPEEFADADNPSASSLTTPAMNISGKDFSFVEVYYSSSLASTHGGVKYNNRFTSVLEPVLKFSTMQNPGDFAVANVGTIVDIDDVMIGGASFKKYTYDMTTAAEWNGNIASLSLEPYKGYPNWGVGLIRLVANEEVDKVAAIEFASPETWATPDIADNVSVNKEFVVTDIKWTPAAEVFEAETVYSAAVTFKAAAGYFATEAEATINGKTADVVNNGNDTFTAYYDFEATSALKEVKVVITGKNAIASRGRYIDLTAKTVALDGSKLPVTDVVWSISDTSVAKVSESGRIYPLVNGTVVVTATSVYDPSVSATHEVKITNQGTPVEVKFDKNTHEDVQGVPESVYVFGNFTPEAYDLKRDGFFFLGWSVDEDALAPDKSFNITEPTTLYAKWGAGYEWSFDDNSTALSATYRPVSYSNGIATYGPNDGGGTAASAQIILEKNGLNALGIETSKHQAIEIRVSLPVDSQLKYYLRSSTEDGSELSPWNEAANTNSIDQTLKSANAPGEFQIVNYDLSNHAAWNMYPLVERIRLDLPQAGPDGGMQIDYIRLLSSVRTVKFDGNGGLIPLYGGEVTSFKETYKTGNIPLPEDPTREGYEFLGWAKKTEDYTKLYKNKFVVTDDVVLYAIWTPAANLNEETVVADGAEVTANDNGSVTITSEEVTAPVIDVADTLEVGDNQTIVVKVTADYASTENGETVLLFTDEEGTPHEVVIKEDGLDGEETIIVDLSEEGFEGTVSDVKLAMPTGIINSLTVDTVAFTTEELSVSFEDNAGDVVKPRPTVTTVVGGKVPSTENVVYPSLGGGTISEHGSSTSKTPADKKTDKVTRPADDAVPSTGTQSGTTTPTTPATPSKFPLTKTYDGRFTDVKSSNWFYGDVEKSFRLGLMNGKSDTTFVPDGTVTLAEAITVAARMNAIYNGQTITQGTGNNWYQPYVEYATKKAIITSGQYNDYTALATREQVALMFVRALPASWYTQKNLFLTIPDVPASSASFGAIQRLYNAGVVTGVDDKYNFKPADNIKRSELSAIINRVALVDSRLRVVTEDEKNSNIKIFDSNAVMNNLTIGNCVEKEWAERNGGAYAVPAKADPVVNGLQNLLGGTVDADTYKKVTVVIRSESEVVGAQGQMFFWSDTIQLSEANSVRVSLPKADAEGNIKIEFKMDTNAAWKGPITNLRFDPFNAMFDFSIVSITFE